MIEYFGTDLTQAGHYFWDLDYQRLNRSRRLFEHMPFNPEGLPYAGYRKEFPKGTVKFYSFSGFTICAISGSCSDTRPGSKSIFFIEKDLPFLEFKAMLEQDETVKKIIKKMPFELKW